MFFNKANYTRNVKRVGKTPQSNASIKAYPSSFLSDELGGVGGGGRGGGVDIIQHSVASFEIFSVLKCES